MIEVFPEGLGQFVRWMYRFSIVYAVLLTGTLFVTLGSPYSSFVSLPVTLFYFGVWVPVMLRVRRRIRAHDGALCYACGYPMEGAVGARCTACGHVQTEKDRRAIEQLLGAERREAG